MRTQMTGVLHRLFQYGRPIWRWPEFKTISLPQRFRKGTMPMRGALRAACLAVVACQFSVATTGCVHARRPSYDVVPASWISGNPSEDKSRAYVFPSLTGSDRVTKLTLSLSNFFSSKNQFRTPSVPFQWTTRSGRTLELSVSRMGIQPAVKISIDSASMTAIRRLHWSEFHELQGAFRRWLCRRS